MVCIKSKNKSMIEYPVLTSIISVINYSAYSPAEGVAMINNVFHPIIMKMDWSLYSGTST